ncbi:Transcription factor iws1 [Desmophyllum pertusum]|uniref:Transcription factor iws1 n=1 Tax=Desmophyllum pertusum TaxID=174260 RepID=A0A9X0DAK5_9CNID|nr:Transcription factor iws1 [Desmophyllum pertusum]
MRQALAIFPTTKAKKGQKRKHGEKQSEDSNDSGSVNSPVEEEVDDKEDGSKQEKENIGSPLYDQEMSPVSSTSATAEEHENTSSKVERDAFSNEGEFSSLAAHKHAEETLESESKQQHLVEGDVEGEDEVSSQRPRETGEDASEEQSGGTSNAAENAAERRRTISSGAITDDDLEMPISPLGLGLSGTESELVDDILKSDVSKLLPDIKEDSKEDPIDQNDDDDDDDEETKEEKSFAESEPAEQDDEGLESGEEAGEQLIADIFGASDEEEEFVGFGQEDIEVTKKKKGARDRKHHSLSVGSEIYDEEGEVTKDSDETMKVPKPKSSKPVDSDSDDDAFDDKPAFVSDFDMMIQKRKRLRSVLINSTFFSKQINRTFRKKRKNVDIISDSDDAIAHMITQMKEVAEEDRVLNERKEAATKKLKMLPSVLTHLHKADLQMTFLDLGVLTVLKDWLTALPDGSLPHLQIREGLLKALTEFPPMDGRALKMSGVGKAVMYLCRHPKETRQNKKMAGKLINDWARPIFGVTANFKSLSREEREERDYQNMSKKRRLSSVDSDGGKTPKSIDSALKSGKKSVRPGDKGFVMRARVPMPSNKDYVVRPQNSIDKFDDFINRKPQKTMDRFEKQKRKFDEKKKLLNRGSQRAVDISIEGRKMAL